MKKTTKFALSSLAAGIAFAALTTTAQAQEEWTMTSTWPDNLDLIKIDQHWAELVNQLAGEELQINFRSGGTLMPGTEVFDATETGSIEAAGDWPGDWAGTNPAVSPLATTASSRKGKLIRYPVAQITRSNSASLPSMNSTRSPAKQATSGLTAISPCPT